MDFFKKASQSSGSGEHGDHELLNMAQKFMASHHSSGSAPTSGAPMASDPASIRAGQGVDAAAAPAHPGVSQAANSGVYTSAQTLYKGLQDKYQGKQSNIANEDLARAASEVLGAAEHYGISKDSQYGQYFHKAEDFLDKYGRPKTKGQ